MMIQELIPILAPLLTARALILIKQNLLIPLLMPLQNLLTPWCPFVLKIIIICLNGYAAIPPTHWGRWSHWVMGEEKSDSAGVDDLFWTILLPL